MIKNNRHLITAEFAGGRISTMRLVTANRSRVSIHGRPRKNFPHIWFDHHAKDGCCLSYSVGAWRSQNFWGCCRASHNFGRWHGWLLKRRYSPHVLPYQIWSL